MNILSTYLSDSKKTGTRFLGTLACMCGLMSALTATAQDFYVTPDGQAPTDYKGEVIENAWTGTATVTLTTLGEALEQAQPGDEIWVQGFEQVTDLAKQVYVVPVNTDGFVLKSGVKLYGGFKGNEKSLEDRATLGEAYQFTYRSILSADRQTNGASEIDKIDPALLIYPGSPTRGDNALHVLQLQLNAATENNANAYRTEVDGFTIVGGHARGAYGGGIYVQGGEYSTSYTIRRCFFFNNYAQQGGAIYVDVDAGRNYTTDDSYINQCVVYNNVAGEMATVSNSGAGIYLAGRGTVVNTAVFNNENGGVRISAEARIVNSTITRNTAAGVDLIATGTSTDQRVVNTVIWGNTRPFIQYNPGFRHSAYHEVTAADGTNGNIYVGDKNNDRNNPSPFFESPSTRISFDRDFNWQYNAYPLWSWNILEGSAFAGKGDVTAYDKDKYGPWDLRGDTWNTETFSMGAYQLVTVPSDRILRVDAGSKTASPDGKTWNTAYKNVQEAIDKLAESDQPGEVWVKAGTYEPTELMEAGKDYTAAFIMKDGISVYGGFAGTEESRDAREKDENVDMSWAYKNKTVFVGSAYAVDGKCTWNETDEKWHVTGVSSHVVWLAPTDGSPAFGHTTVLEGVTIKGGHALTANAGTFNGDKGAGVYMVRNAELVNCVITENQADGEGGAVYVNGGRITGSLIYNNEASKGGGVYMQNSGLVLRSVLSNNSAQDGAAVYMKSEDKWTDGLMHPEYLMMSTSVVSHNTSRKNGAVYCDRGGVVLQSTLTNNLSASVTDDADKTTAHTGGLYIDRYGLVINSVLWNNLINGVGVPMYAINASVENVRFYHTAFSGMNNAVWNNTLQQELQSLSENNTGTDAGGLLTPDFTVVDNFIEQVGVQGSWKDITYYWEPRQGSNLRSGGMVLGAFPAEVVLSPELDLRGDLFAQNPGMGAVKIDPVNLNPERDGNVMRLYVDAQCTTPDHDGSSWEKAYRSLNEAISYFAGLSESELGGIDGFEIWVHEGDCSPRYGFSNIDPNTATIDILKTPKPLTIKGGFSRQTQEWNPLLYRSVIDGNSGGNVLEDGLYHCMSVDADAEVVIDGFHVVGGYAAGSATYKQGAGLIMKSGTRVTVRNSVFENHTAHNGAAVSGSEGSVLTLENCVINNNTNTIETNPIIKAETLVMRHVTVVNNIGAAPTGNVYGTSFSAGNSSGNSQTALQTVGEAGAQMFANPTNKVGAQSGFDTYLGGYSEFRPLTGSSVAGTALINKVDNPVSDLLVDITGRGRNLGGIPDLGAYEAILPESGSVFYVTAEGAGRKDGSSWENAIAGNDIYNVNNEPASANIDVVTTDTRYIGFYSNRQRPYAEISNASKTFTSAGNSVGNITNTRQETYVSGLQYAVEKASAFNSDAGDYKMQVWVAGGTYTDYKGFVIRDYVEVLGGFPNEGTPGLEDRYPLIAKGIPLREDVQDLNVEKYETILQIQSSAPVNWEYNSSTHLSTASVNASVLTTTLGVTRKPVLFQPDVCMTTTGPVSDMARTDYLEYVGAIWDGFTIRHGFQHGYYATRDGGGGVRMYRGVTLQNCVVRDNVNATRRNRGGGIYCDGKNSKVINCFVINNAALLQEFGEEVNWDCVGGGMYMILGTSYNTLLANNYATGDGGGVFLENAVFYNNTIAYNNSGSGAGGMYQFTANLAAGLTIYNTLFYGNKGKALEAYSTSYFEGAHNCFVSTEEEIDADLKNRLYSGVYGVKLQNPFELGDAAAQNYNFRLNGSTYCLNNGTDELPNGITLPETDVDFTNRIKDCTVDIGAYERNNEDAVTPDGDGVYYVTFNGNGTAVGNSPQNAACAMKLQEVLNAAGKRAVTGANAIVKIAGYEGATGNGLVYHANTLSDPNDPLSYTFVIPEGVTVMGGYDEGSYASGVYQNDGNWNEENRNAAQYMTVLSAICQATASRQEVNGYHVVQFGTDGTTALARPAVLDGVYLEDGKATSMVGGGTPETKGGGAIVPKGAHVRNCVVRHNEAVEGGGLYVLPGGLVSGCGVMQNTAETGAGIYISQNGETLDATNRSHIMSCTVAGNTAAGIGGGIYLEAGAGLTANTVIWGNLAQSDKNVSGVTGMTFEDELFDKAVASGEHVDAFYPFNNCFVETYEMPGNYGNTSMTTELNDYFENNYYTPRAFSPLVKGGANVALQNMLNTEVGVSAYDIQGIPRVAANRNDDFDPIDAGAYAREGGMMRIPQNMGEVIRRIFVLPNASGHLKNGESEEVVMGRSFQTPLTTLDDALEYITEVRSLTGIQGATSIEFEIWMAGGTYKPRKTRQGASSGVEPSQRQNSFVIPDGVKVFGGFSGEEGYAYIGEESIDGNLDASRNLEDITDDKVQEKLDLRQPGDLSGNDIMEPWEFNTPTILSGEVNLSEDAKHVYHVVYSNQSNATLGGVTLDGLTVMNGETYHQLGFRDELGRGGGIYTVGVDYTLSRCRLLNNKAIHGGAVFALNAKVNVSGSTFVGNGTVDNPEIESGSGWTGTEDVRGGAVYVASSETGEAGLYAVNTLWANNEAVGVLNNQQAKGGAIATSGTGIPVDLMNNTIVRNKAGEYGAVYAPGGATIKNSVVWGNANGDGSNAVMPMDGSITYTACDAFVATEVTDDNHNLKLGVGNKALDGPHFETPSVEAGLAGFIWEARWNPSGISLLVDAGDGTETQSAYNGWFTSQGLNDKPYMNNIGYERFVGPRVKNAEGNDMPKVIDMGLYEYQYPLELANLDAVYVATEESGNASGDSWENATSDLRGALVAMANPNLANRTDRAVYIKAGEYNMRASLALGGAKKAAYWINMAQDNGALESLKVEGSYDDAGNQNFSRPTVISISPADGKESTVLLDIKTNTKPVTVTGLAFHSAGTGVQANASGAEGKLTLKNVAFQDNHTGADLTGTTGEVLIANALFADGGTGLQAAGTTTVVNATFANNETAGIHGTADVHNSVAWKSGTAGFGTGTSPGNVLLGETANNDIVNGPNFVDPENSNILLRDYRFRPNQTLLNKGDDESYATHVLGSAGTIPNTEQDLSGGVRVVETIDVGAYEYASPLQPVIYVKSGVAGGDYSGKDWANAMSDLQGAADLAAIYASAHTGEKGYVFVHRNVATETVTISQGGVRMYGGMNNETGTDAASVLAAREGMLEADGHSRLGHVTVSNNSVVDGFEVTGPVNVANGGVLSTSILSGSEGVIVGTDGFLYNSIVDGVTVNGEGHVVNVTAVNGGTLPTTAVNSVPDGADNGYGLDGYWKFQLKDDADTYINKGVDSETQICIEKVEHSSDLAGNKRIRGTVDYGCFETWNIEGAPAEVTDTDYPRGRSVVYVREGSELRLKRDYVETASFNPGFLLLEHGAGLWGGGQQVGLTNFAAERKLTAENAYKDLVAMPFRLDRMTVDGQDDQTAVKSFRYDGAERARYGYKFSDSSSKAWTETTDVTTVTEGLLFEAPEGQSKDMKLRFYGRSYIENGQPKSVLLYKYNFNSPWSSPADTGDKFTHKENMSWNLFGSPYLCTMNYEDMEYGRVVYGYANNGYYTQNTWNEDAVVTGSIPAGSAVFTQTATLKEQETFAVNLRAEEIQNQAARSTNLAVYIAPAVDKRGAETAGIYDELQLEAVPTEEAVTEFDLARDGVKWMNGNREPEIFAARDGGRYSLLSAIDKEGTTKVGVSLPEAGNYIVGIPEDIGAEDYEYVVLTDAVANKAVDLKEGAYVFSAAEAGDFDGRFTLTFHKTGGERDGRIFVKSGWGEATVVGVNEGDNVTVFTVDGKAVANSEASGSEVRFVLAKGAYLFVVKGAGGNDAVVKSVVR